MKELLKLKVKSKLFKKFKSFVVSGWKDSERFKKGIDLYRFFNKENDSYVEIVKNYVTGKIEHQCKEKLSEHIGHGSAKINKKLD